MDWCLTKLMCTRRYAKNNFIIRGENHRACGVFPAVTLPRFV